MGKRTRKGVQESLHLFWYRSIMKNCADLQLEIDKKCIKNNVVIVYYVRKSIIYFVKNEDTGKRGEKIWKRNIYFLILMER